jgi:hypothetical protein
MERTDGWGEAELVSGFRGGFAKWEMAGQAKRNRAGEPGSEGKGNSLVVGFSPACLPNERTGANGFPRINKRNTKAK